MSNLSHGSTQKFYRSRRDNHRKALRMSLETTLFEASHSAKLALERILYLPVNVRALNLRIGTAAGQHKLNASDKDRMIVFSQTLHNHDEEVGKAVLAVPVAAIPALAASSLGWDGNISDVPNGNDIELLKEVTNILLGRFVEVTAQALSLTVSPGLPRVILEAPKQAIEQALVTQSTKACFEACLEVTTRGQDTHIILLVIIDKCSLPDSA